MVLKGQVEEKERFIVTRESQESIRRKKRHKDTVTTSYIAYLVRFDDLLPRPVYVSLVYNEKESRPAVRERMDLLDARIGSPEAESFKVNEDYSLQRSADRGD
jgi:hypothetical protein